MIKYIKCWMKGHKFLMGFVPKANCYTITPFDRCSCCNKERGNWIDNKKKLQCS